MVSYVQLMGYECDIWRRSELIIDFNFDAHDVSIYF